MTGLIEMMLLRAMSASAAREESRRRKRIDDAHAEIESCGVELVQVAATGAMEVRKKEAEKPVEIPPELAGLDWETLINQQYTGGLRGKF